MYIKRVEFAEVPVNPGKGQEIEMHFIERYYEKYDVFRVDKTEQQFIVVAHPERISDKDFKVIVKLNSNNYDTEFDPSGCQVGDTTRWIGNAMPEMSEEGKQKERRKPSIKPFNCRNRVESAAIIGIVQRLILGQYPKYR